MRRVLLFLLAGGLGGLIVWCIAEPSPLTIDRPQGFDVDYTAMYLLGALLGLGIGAALGVAEGLDRGSLKQSWVYALGGAGVGLLGGFIGIYIGQRIYGPWAAFNDRLSAPNPANPFSTALLPLAFLSNVVARTVGWTFIGLFVGASMGVVQFTPRRVKSGLIGGLLGGAVGGFCFEIIAQILRWPEMSRAIGFMSVGAGTGFGVSLAQQLARQAWVRVVVGRNEGRDYLLDKEINTLGRDEMSDVPLFGDTAVGKKHAVIKRVSGVWFIQDGGSPAGTLVNGQSTRERPLQEGDRITIGGFQLEFHAKGGQAIPVAQRDEAPAPLLAPQTVPSGACAFCGAKKNPLTGACACTPLGNPSPVPAGAGAPAALAMNRPLTLGTSSPSLASSQYSLVVASGPHAGQRFPISGNAGIGRTENNALAFPTDTSLSRKHATLSPGPGGLHLHDEGSSNGTFVNGARITDATLQPGDEIQVGDTRLRVE